MLKIWILYQMIMLLYNAEDMDIISDDYVIV